MSIIIASDGFIWKTLEPSQADKIFKANCIELYRVVEDDTESLIESVDDLMVAQSDESSYVCIEVGLLAEDIIVNNS